MAKAKTPSIEVQNEDNIVINSISQVMHDSMMPYSEYVILERALPRVEDGLKPVQRRILYTMKELGLDPEKPHRKSARIVGDTLGKYHPHGDTSVYDAMARMAQDFNMRETLVDGQGNFGSIDGDSPAAMRYTEARMTPLALEMLRDIEKESVSFRLNFDDTLKEPELLPARFPNLLVNGAMGIAVGFATDIPPHNLGEVIDGVCYYLDNPECSVDDLMKIIPAPDFPTGALILSDSEFDNVYKNGKGKIVMRAKTSFEAGPNGKKLIVISEIPFQMNKARMLERLAKLCEEKKGVLTNVTDIRDESDKNGLRAVIELKKDADENVVLNYLYKYSDLQVNYNANMVAIANGKPERLNLRSAIGYYAQHQKDVVLKRTKFDLAKALKDKHILEGLIKAVSIIEEVIATIRMSKSPSEARENLMKLFSFSREQAQAILDLRLQRLTNLEIVALKNEFKELCKHIEKLEEIINSPEALVRTVKGELMEIKEKYATPRKSKIIDANAKIEISEEDFIVAEDVTVIITRNQDIKVVDQKTVARSSNDINDISIGAGDNVEYVIKTSTDKKLLLFTDMGSCYYLSPSTIPYSKWRDRGVPLSGVFTAFNRAERIVGVYSTKTFEADKFVLMTTKNGTTKKTALDQFDASRSKVLAIDLVEDDSLRSVIITDGKDDVLFVSKKGMALRCANADIGVMGRNSKGVRSMKLKDGDSICAVCEIHHDSGAGVALITNNGSGKTVSASQIPCQKRAGGGFQIIKFNKNGSNGVNLICTEYTNSADEREFTVQFEDSNTEKLPISSLPKMPAASAGKGLFDWLQEIARCFMIKG